MLTLVDVTASIRGSRVLLTSPRRSVEIRKISCWSAHFSLARRRCRWACDSSTMPQRPTRASLEAGADTDGRTERPRRDESASPRAGEIHDATVPAEPPRLW